MEYPFWGGAWNSPWGFGAGAYGSYPGYAASSPSALWGADYLNPYGSAFAPATPAVFPPSSQAPTYTRAPTQPQPAATPSDRETKLEREVARLRGVERQLTGQVHDLTQQLQQAYQRNLQLEAELQGCLNSRAAAPAPAPAPAPAAEKTPPTPTAGKGGYLGLQVADGFRLRDDTNKHGYGAVKVVRSYGPAAQAGLQTLDFITTVRGVPVYNLNDFRAALQVVKPGDTVSFGVERNSRELTFVVTADARAPGQESPSSSSL